MNYHTVLENIPDYQEFLTVEELDASSRELASRYPGNVELSVIGYSRKEHPIYCLKIGKGKRPVLMFACPHPNEPIGTMTIEYFSRILAEDDEFLQETDCTWYLIKCVDPDGTALNEGWFKGPFTLRNYAEHYYRPAMDQQVEWTFPVDYKQLHFHEPIPETQALMNLINQIRPELMYSLHNAGFGGVFWYISKDRPQIYSRLGEIPGKYGLPLALGEPEMPCCIPYAPAIYQMISVEDMYDFYEKYVCPDPSALLGCGASSDGYANRVGDTLTLVCELPYFYASQVDDERPTAMSRREAMLKNCEIGAHCTGFLQEQIGRIGDAIDADNPFSRMIRDVIRSMGGDMEGKKQMIRQNPEFDQPARVCEVFDNLYGASFNWMTFVGLLVHMIRLEQEKNPVLPQVLEEAYQAGMEELDALETYVNENVTWQVIPIRKLVAIQLECMFTALEYMDSAQ
jgi:hypothetical protein